MKAMEWSETFELGVPEIDCDHRAMVSISNAVLATMMSGRIELSVRLVGDLLALSKSHFEKEEEILRQHGYPQVDAHAKYHSELYEKAESMKKTCEQQESNGDKAECYKAMVDFLVGDIVKGDSEFKSFLERKGVIERRL